jgi:nucleoside-diphosphate-sugar epimerase
MRTVFVTGSTGYLGSYTVTRLLRDQPDVRVALLVRGRDDAEAREKLWRSLQLHMDAKEFWDTLSRVDFVLGDLTSTQPRLGIAPEAYERTVRGIESVLHIAASLNRKSEKACLNTNLRGTLAVLELARDAKARGGLRRYSHVSTVAVCGERDREVVTEDGAIDWNRSDYDPYGRTKKFCEHMAHVLLPDVQKTIFRPSIVMGDSTRPETSQFDMVRAFCVLADLPVVPVRAEARQDIVNADWVGRAIATVHMKDAPKFDCYHLSAGTSSLPAEAIARELAFAVGKTAPRFVGAAEKPFATAAELMMRFPRKTSVALVGSLLHVFLPYITYDTVFDNTRIVSELGASPVPFTAYCAELYRWAKKHDFTYPYLPLPARPAQVQSAEVHHV